jgi:hypothetical protein
LQRISRVVKALYATLFGVAPEWPIRAIQIAIQYEEQPGLRAQSGPCSLWAI